MGAHIQINAAVFITMCGAPDRHTLVLCISRALQPLNGLTHLKAKAWVTILQFKYMSTYHWAISSNL